MCAAHYSVLCVDDDIDTCDLLKQILYLENAADNVQTVMTAGEALRLIASVKFNLYILDYRLPDMLGVELCRMIRKMDETSRIMFFTAEARNSAQQVAKSAGADAYLIKPNGLDVLTKTINELAQPRAVSFESGARA